MQQRDRKKIHFDILTLFPECFPGPLGVGIAGKALAGGFFSIQTHNFREFTTDRHRTVDDYPYGGGPGLIMKPEPIFQCLDSLGSPRPFTILLSPQGVPWTQSLAERLSKRDRIALICGRYEGVDERIREFAVDMDVSIGDYIVSGGEVAALVLIETMVRLLPGVVGDKDSVETDTFSNNLLKYPQYTRPPEYRGYSVPEILLSGHHEKIRAWRKKQAEERTKRLRPDLLTCKTTANNDSKSAELSRDDDVAGNKSFER